MFVYETAMGSWTYPEPSVLRIGGVPLFTGFGYTGSTGVCPLLMTISYVMVWTVHGHAPRYGGRTCREGTETRSSGCKRP